jgi:hypothetical protein
MIINLISGPRNISTALMYSFAQRPDTLVIDEPFYGNYLQRFDADHPGKEEVLASMETDVDRILAGIHGRHGARPYTFVKNMGHHLVDMDTAFLSDFTNVFLIRDPKPLIASLAQIIPNPTMRDVGLSRQAELYRSLSKTQSPLVIDSHEVLKDPPTMLRRICDALDIPFYEAMLTWPKGMIYDDVPWAKYWYKNVMNSTGFEKQTTSTRPLPEHCKPLLEECLPHYNFLKQHTLTA